MLWFDKSFVRLLMIYSWLCSLVNSLLNFLDLDPPDVNFNPQGYLFLAGKDGVETLKQNHEVQRYVNPERSQMKTSASIKTLVNYSASQKKCNTKSLDEMVFLATVYYYAISNILTIGGCWPFIFTHSGQ